MRTSKDVKLERTRAMTNVKLLKDKIEGSGLRMRFIAKKMGMSYPTFLATVNGEREFKQSEIVDMCDILRIPTAEREPIFFATMSTK